MMNMTDAARSYTLGLMHPHELLIQEVSFREWAAIVASEACGDVDVAEAPLSERPTELAPVSTVRVGDILTIVSLL